MFSSHIVLGRLYNMSDLQFDSYSLNHGHSIFSGVLDCNYCCKEGNTGLSLLPKFRWHTWATLYYSILYDVTECMLMNKFFSFCFIFFYKFKWSLYENQPLMVQSIIVLEYLMVPFLQKSTTTTLQESYSSRLNMRCKSSIEISAIAGSYETGTPVVLSVPYW